MFGQELLIEHQNFIEIFAVNGYIEQYLNQKIWDKAESFLKESIKKDSYVFALDLRGKQFSSEEFSKKIDDIALNFNSSITFIIGGTLGLNEEVLSLCNEKISFSKMTFPHQLFRVFLLEQIFRAFKISRGETYHW